MQSTAETSAEVDPDQAKAQGFIRPVHEQPARFLLETSYEGESWPPRLTGLPDLVDQLRTNYERFANYGDGYEIKVWRYEGSGQTTPVIVVPVEPGRQDGDQLAQDYLLLAGPALERIAVFTVTGDGEPS